jgi:hypothetical protein
LRCAPCAAAQLQPFAALAIDATADGCDVNPLARRSLS